MENSDLILIDREYLRKVLEEMEEEAADGGENDGSDGTTRILEPVKTTTREMMDLLDMLPSMTLTRCRNCEHWKAEEGQEYGKCGYFSREDLAQFIQAITYMTGPADYCSFAERRATDGIDIRG
jgi:hypothetical protein